jgi:hypothetical protein
MTMIIKLEVSYAERTLIVSALRSYAAVGQENRSDDEVWCESVAERIAAVQTTDDGPEVGILRVQQQAQEPTNS